MVEEMPGNWEPVWAIVRLDASAARGRGGLAGKDFRILKVLRNEEAAREEVERLNVVNRGKGVIYAYQPTRLEKP